MGAVVLRGISSAVVDARGVNDDGLKANIGEYLVPGTLIIDEYLVHGSAVNPFASANRELRLARNRNERSQEWE